METLSMSDLANALNIQFGKKRTDGMAWEFLLELFDFVYPKNVFVYLPLCMTCF